MTRSDSPEPKFRRRAEERPDEVLDAALELFTARGYANTSVAQIARAAGISKGAVYLYFPSKQAILEGLVRRAVTPIATGALAQADLEGGDIRENLRTILALIAAALGNPTVFAIPKIVIREAVVAPEIAEMYRRAVFDTVFPAAIQLLGRAVEQGQLRPVDPEFTLRTIMGPIFMHILLAEIFGVVPERGLAFDQLIDNHLDILMHGLFAQSEPAQDD